MLWVYSAINSSGEAGFAATFSEAGAGRLRYCDTKSWNFSCRALYSSASFGAIREGVIMHMLLLKVDKDDDDYIELKMD